MGIGLEIMSRGSSIYKAVMVKLDNSELMAFVALRTRELGALTHSNPIDPPKKKKTLIIRRTDEGLLCNAATRTSQLIYVHIKTCLAVTKQGSTCQHGSENHLKLSAITCPNLCCEKRKPGTHRWRYQSQEAAEYGTMYGCNCSACWEASINSCFHLFV